MTAPASPGVPMTVDEWAALDEDVPGELVDGVLVEEEMPSLVHDVVGSWLIAKLAPWVDARGGCVAMAGLKLAVRPRTGRIPDVAVFFGGRKVEPYGAVRTPPDVVIEIVSREPRDERRERVEKPDDYAAFGVRWNWLVDPELRSFEIWELGADGRYARAFAALAGKVEPIPGCDGLSLDLDALWAKVDGLLT